ncbi:hypothetical protein D3C87_2149290 [compost metagenome]
MLGIEQVLQLFYLFEYLKQFFLCLLLAEAFRCAGTDLGKFDFIAFSHVIFFSERYKKRF